MISYEKYFYLYWVFGLSSEFISVENSSCIQCFSLFLSTRLSFNLQIFALISLRKAFSSDKHMICILFVWGANTVSIQVFRDVSSDKSRDTKDEISSLDLAGGKKQNHNHNRMDDKNTNAAQGRSIDFKRHCWVFYRWSSKYSSESPQKMFLIWILPSQCLQNNK